MTAALQKLQLILVAYGPWGIFLLSVIDSFGVPLPGATDFVMITIGAGSVHDPRRAYLIAVLAVVGSLIGNVALYYTARHGAAWMVKRPPKAGKRRKFREWFHRFGLLTVFVPAVTPVVPLPLKVFVISAGALHAPLGRFVAIILLARSIRYVGEAYLGIKLGEAGTKNFLVHHGWTLAGAALAVCVAAYLLPRLIDRRRPAGDTITDPLK